MWGIKQEVFTSEYNYQNMKKEVLIDILALLILLFSLTTMYQSLFDRISINRILGAFIALTAGALFCQKPNIISFMRIVVLCVDAFISFAFTMDIKTEINEWIFVLTTALLMTILGENENKNLLISSFIKRKKMLSILIHIECVTLLILLRYGIGMKEAWGGGIYFVGLCNGEHTMGSLCCLILTTILFYCKINQKGYLWYSILALIPMYAILQCGARVFLIPMVIIFLLFLKFIIKKRIYRYILYCIGLLLFYRIFINSTMMDKFEFVFSNASLSNQLEAFTSGRSRFWLVDIQHYLSGNIFELLFGRSFAEVYIINKRNVGMFIWSHNDIIYLLNGGGILGTISYVKTINKTLNKATKSAKEKKQGYLLILYLYLPMLLNGFMTYQHLVYSFIILYLAATIKHEDLLLNRSRWLNGVE